MTPSTQKMRLAAAGTSPSRCIYCHAQKCYQRCTCPASVTGNTAMIHGVRQNTSGPGTKRHRQDVLLQCLHHESVCQFSFGNVAAKTEADLGQVANLNAHVNEHNAELMMYRNLQSCSEHGHPIKYSKVVPYWSIEIMVCRIIYL
ncbi:hypothetical protein ABBQ38_15506 [Trebouxia sp. C0009 RCD-2024]